MRIKEENERRIINLISCGYSTEFIEKECNMLKKTIIAIAKKRNLEIKNNDDLNKKICFLMLSGINAAEIADKLLISAAEVEQVFCSTFGINEEKKRRDTHPCGELFSGLSNAIVVMAANDYKIARLAIAKNPKDKAANDTLREVMEFFKSQWYEALCTIDCKTMLRKLDNKIEKEINK